MVNSSQDELHGRVDFVFSRAQSVIFMCIELDKQYTASQNLREPIMFDVA